jgi:hypothetical protein
MTSSDDDDVEKPGNLNNEPAQIRDLIDFFRRWPEFRQTAHRLRDRSDLSPLEHQTIHWLIQLADRVSEHDLGSTERP